MENARYKRKSRDVKKARFFNGGTSKGRVEIKNKFKCKKRFSRQASSKFPTDRDDKTTKPRALKGRSGNSPNEKPTCANC